VDAVSYDFNGVVAADACADRLQLSHRVSLITHAICRLADDGRGIGNYVAERVSGGDPRKQAR